MSRRQFLVGFLMCIPFLALGQVEEIESLEQKIREQTKDLSCKSDADCRTLGVGHRVCGGYSKFIIYSENAVEPTKIKSLAERHYELESKYHRERGIGSICSVEQPRATACLKEKCVDLGDKLNAITPLHWAVKRKDRELIKKLVADGHQIDARGGPFGATPLEYAISQDRSLSLIEFLVNLGADVNGAKRPLSDSRNTPLHRAVKEGRHDIIKYLLKAGADRRAGGEYTPYYYAKSTFKDTRHTGELLNLLRPRKGE